MTEISISCRNVVVQYSLFSQKVKTVKEFLIKKFKGELDEVIKVALSEVSIEARKGECIALVGHNGCGKSTLLKCIAGILPPHSGQIETHGRIAPMIELGAGFDPEMTGRENVYLSCSLMGLTRSEIDAKIAEIERFAELGMFFDAPVKTYSSGMYMRLGFACTTAIEAEIVLIDEILAVGDENFQKKCIEKIGSIRHSGSTVVLVTHDLGTVYRMADRVYVLDQGKLVYSGNPPDAISYYHTLMDEKLADSLSQEQREEEKRRRRLQASESHKAFGEMAKIRRVQFEAQETGVDQFSTSTWGLALDMEVELLEDFSQPVVVGFALQTAEDRRVFGGNSKIFRHEDLPALSKKGVYRIGFRFQHLTLASGTYHIIAAVHNHALDTTLDFERNAGEIKIVNKADPFNFDRDIMHPFAVLSSHHVTEME